MKPLSQVADPEGRLDVMLYQLAGRFLEGMERERGLLGLREHLLPLVEQAIVRSVPVRNVIPREVRAIAKVYAMNRRRVC